MKQATAQELKDFLFYIKELRGDECFCGRDKKPGFSFCYRCWRELTPEMQRRLYKQIGMGYEEAYEEAVAYLRDVLPDV